MVDAIDTTWNAMQGIPGVRQRYVSGQPTPTTSLVDWAAPRAAMLSELAPTGVHSWVPPTSLSRYIEDLVGDVRPPQIEPGRLPSDRVASPIAWQPSVLLEYGPAEAHLVRDALYPIIEKTSGLRLRAGETQILEQPKAESWVARKDSPELDWPLGGSTMRRVKGEPTLVLTDRRIVVHAEIAKEGGQPDGLLLESLLPKFHEFLGLVNDARRSIGSSGLFWSTQVELDWIREIAVRSTKLSKPKGFLNRMFSPVGEFESVAITVEQPGGQLFNLAIAKGENETLAKASELVRALVAALKLPAGPDAASQSWRESSRDVQNGTESIRVLRIPSGLPISICVPRT